MKYIAILLFLTLSCQQPKEEAITAEALGHDVYGLEEEAAESMDFSENQTELTHWDKRFIEAGLVNIQSEIPEILVDLKYSSTDNFFGQDVYDDLENAYLQPEVTQMLQKAFENLQTKDRNLTFLVYDAVRPRAVQQILWDNLDKPDSLKPLYVADPKVGSLHNFGVAVDLTIADRTTGQPLDMGTKYDFFGYAAYPDREAQMLKEGKITQNHINNRKLLREVMLGAGFTGIGSEWWHFNAYSRKVAGQKFEIIP
ncbi:MAG TPA: M15 family metallopeptidase [Anditalea sp.]|nr:M15 family metallopeptidase [Anditalea sp.]